MFRIKWIKHSDFQPPAVDGILENNCEYVHLVHQLLGNPEREHLFPAPAETKGDDVFRHMVSCWDSAYYVLRCLLGWASPGKGLVWYMENRRKLPDEPPLQLLRQVFDNDDQLDLLAAWVWTSRWEDLRPMQYRVATNSHDNAPPAASVQPPDDWWEAFQRKWPRGETKYPINPYYDGAGGNELHLGHFYPVFDDYGEGAMLLRSGPDLRRAVLISDEFGGWYAALARLGSELPSLGDRSWHVDVVVKTTGWLGAFRRSRKTGLWFMGQHRYHEVGNDWQV